MYVRGFFIFNFYIDCFLVMLYFMCERINILFLILSKRLELLDKVKGKEIFNVYI